ncbi:MAG: TetR/AcrR family transcriptional regulator [Calditrichaeota bacterium]|nr:MAG: TetR/AcrR family transcriptional regulator [Calditrichota bacterium]
MGIAERREREKEQRRNMILDAAERLFFSRGVDATTMDDVAEEAELSKGTLYLYFKNKEDLRHGVCLRGLCILKQMFQEAVAVEGNGLFKVRQIGEAYFRFSQEYPNYFQMMVMMNIGEVDLSDRESYACKCHECSEEVMGLVAEALRIGIEDGSIRREIDPLKTAYILWGQTSGMIQIITVHGTHLRNFHGVDPGELIPEMFDLIYHSLKAT